VITGTTAITDFRIQYASEFWRRGGNTTNPTQQITFSFGVFDSGAGSINANSDYNFYIPLDYRGSDKGAATPVAIYLRERWCSSLPRLLF
jgi:hypothetical protein